MSELGFIIEEDALKMEEFLLKASFGFMATNEAASALSSSINSFSSALAGLVTGGTINSFKQAMTNMLKAVVAQMIAMIIK